MRKFWNFETGIEELRDKLRAMLHGNNIYYELSSAGKAWHFEIKCNDEEVALVDEFLDRYFSREYLTLLEA